MKGIDTMKKMTKIEMFAQIKGHLTNQEEIDFIAHEIELLENKKSGTRKPTANQVENENYLEMIMEVLENSNKEMTITEIQEANSELPTSNQRMSSLLKKLTDSGIVEKIYVKRKPYFKKA